MNECETLTVEAVDGLKKNDEDPDSPMGDLEVFLVDLPSKGTLKCGSLINTVCRDGSFVYEHNGDDKPNVDSFTYRLFDNHIPPEQAKFSDDLYLKRMD